MIRKLCTFILAASLALPTFSAPARAGDDLRNLIAAMTVLGLVAAVAHNEQDKPVIAHSKAKPKKKRVNKKRHSEHKRLPSQCRNTFDTREGQRKYFRQNCLNKKYQYAQKLPQRCLRTVRTDRGKRNLYSSQCLSRNGYKTHPREY